MPSKKRTSGAPSGTKRSSKNDALNAKPAKLRIIGGQMRGRTVTYHGAEFTRPMKDNIRENLFNILGKSVKGARAFDLFAGTGALGFESLSRGACSIVLVEQNRMAARQMQKTADSLEVSDKMELIVSDTFHVAETLLKPPAQDTPWIVYLCPPYALWTERFEDLNQIVKATLQNAPPGSVLVTETERSFDHTVFPEGPWDYRSYGKTTLGFIEPANHCGLTWQGIAPQ